jgi:peptide/nickel transport system permease protein
MHNAAGPESALTQPIPGVARPSRLVVGLRYMRRNVSLVVGILLLLTLALFVAIGHIMVDTSQSRALSVAALRPPSLQYPVGTDRQGRDLLATMVAGTPLTLRIGFIAGFLGVGMGTVLGFVSAYYRGKIDTLIRSIVDIGLTVPGLLVLIIIAVSLKKTLTVNQMALIVAALAWLNPTRTIRAQVLSLRERDYVEVARLSGMSGPEIIVKELIPNLLPYLAATLVNAVSSAILASIGLEVLGLGPVDARAVKILKRFISLIVKILCLSAGSLSGPLLVSFFSIHSQSIIMEEKAHDHRSDSP